MNLNRDLRIEAIYKIIKRNDVVKVCDLAKHFDVSDMTIRRDLDALENTKVIERLHGKAKIKPFDSEMEYSKREQLNLLSKQVVAQKAVEYLDDAGSIFIDGSTTCNEFVKLIPKSKKITVFTNSIATIDILKNMHWLNTFVIGGFIINDRNTLEDEYAIKLVKNIFVDTAFISCAGFSYEGFFNSTVSGSMIKKSFLLNCEKLFLLADNSKFNKRGMFLLGDWSEVSTLITDKPLPKFEQNYITSNKVNVVIIDSM